MGFKVTDANKWPNGIVPYRFVMPTPDDARATTIKNLIIACMRRWESFVNVGGTYIRFVEDLTGDDANVKFIKLTDKNAGNSSGGLGRGSGTSLNTGSKISQCFTLNWAPDIQKSIPHELGHILGLAHENERNGTLEANSPYVTGAVPRMCTKAGSLQYEAVLRSQAKYVGFGNYDLNSIMHYPKTDNWYFNCGDDKYLGILATLQLTMNYPSAQHVTDGAWRPSAGDIATLQSLYPLPPPPAQNTTT